MNKLLKIIAFMIICDNCLFALDLTTQTKIFEDNSFVILSEDKNDYNSLIQSICSKNLELQKVFDKKLSKKITIYIFKDQKSFSKKVFDSDEPVQNATGFGDYVNSRIYLTSIYDTSKNTNILKKVPLHELVHLYINSEYVWIREGVAHYFSDMIKIITTPKLASGFADFIFYSDTIEKTAAAYNESGWLHKFIYEELCKKNIVMYKKYLRNPKQFSLINLKTEKELFASWRIYMIANNYWENLTKASSRFWGQAPKQLKPMLDSRRWRQKKKEKKDKTIL